MADDVAQTLASRLNRDRFTGPDDLVFPNEVARWIDGSARRRRYKDAQSRAGLRPLRFHDLRHTFGSLAVTQAESRRDRLGGVRRGPLLALDYALDMLEAKREAHPEAA
jgi:integrase